MLDKQIGKFYGIGDTLRTIKNILKVLLPSLVVKKSWLGLLRHFLLSKLKHASPELEFFSDLQIWHLTVLQSLEQQGCIVSHLQFLIKDQLHFAKLRVMQHF